MSRLFCIFSATWFLGFGIYLAAFARVAKHEAEKVPDEQRPAWSFMPLWFYRALGVLFLGLSALFFYFYFRRA